MDGEVAQFTEKEKAKEEVCLSIAGAGVLRMVDMVGTVSCESPVVATVLEQISEWHSSV